MATRLTGTEDINFGDLNDKNKYVLSYNSISDKFELISSDTILSGHTNTGSDDFDSTFTDAIEAKIDTSKISYTALDGGMF